MLTHGNIYKKQVYEVLLQSFESIFFISLDIIATHLMNVLMKRTRQNKSMVQVAEDIQLSAVVCSQPACHRSAYMSPFSEMDHYIRVLCLPRGINSQGCDQSEVHCFKNPCSRQCQQVKGAAAVFDVFSLNAKNLYVMNQIWSEQAHMMWKNQSYVLPTRHDRI